MPITGRSGDQQLELPARLERPKMARTVVAIEPPTAVVRGAAGSTAARGAADTGATVAAAAPGAAATDRGDGDGDSAVVRAAEADECFATHAADDGDDDEVEWQALQSLGVGGGDGRVAAVLATVPVDGDDGRAAAAGGSARALPTTAPRSRTAMSADERKRRRTAQSQARRVRQRRIVSAAEAAAAQGAPPLLTPPARVYDGYVLAAQRRPDRSVRMRQTRLPSLPQASR